MDDNQNERGVHAGNPSILTITLTPAELEFPADLLLSAQERRRGKSGGSQALFQSPVQIFAVYSQ